MSMLKYFGEKKGTESHRMAMIFPWRKVKLYTLLNDGEMVYLGNLPLRGNGGLLRVEIPKHRIRYSATGKFMIKIGKVCRIIHGKARIQARLQGICVTANLDENIALEVKI